MKSFEIKAIGLEEMSENAMLAVNGGNWVTTLLKVLKYLGLTASSWAIEKGLDSTYEALKKNEDIEVDYVYYGGVLDPAICYGDK